MDRKAAGREAFEPELLAAGGPRTLMHASERLLAMGYGLTYDAVVSGFRPYEALLDEVFAYVERSAPLAGSGRPPTILDVSCGIGTVAARLSARGYAVTAVDAVGHLVDVARRRHGHRPASSLRFEHVDVATAPMPGAGRYDVVISMHTLYWHPQPEAVIAACRRLLAPGGHAVFLTYSRPARVVHVRRGARSTGPRSGGARVALAPSHGAVRADASRRPAIPHRSRLPCRPANRRLRDPGLARNVPRRHQPTGVGSRPALKRDRASRSSVSFDPNDAVLPG